MKAREVTNPERVRRYYPKATCIRYIDTGNYAVYTDHRPDAWEPIASASTAREAWAKAARQAKINADVERALRKRKYGRYAKRK